MDLEHLRTEICRSRLMMRLGALLVALALLGSLLIAPPKAQALTGLEESFLFSLILQYFVSSGVITWSESSRELADWIAPYWEEFKGGIGGKLDNVGQFFGYDSYAAFLDALQLAYVKKDLYPNGVYEVLIPKQVSVKLAEFTDWFVSKVFSGSDVTIDPATGDRTVTVPASRNYGSLPTDVFRLFKSSFEQMLPDRDLSAYKIYCVRGRWNPVSGTCRSGIYYEIYAAPYGLKKDPYLEYPSSPDIDSVLRFEWYLPNAREYLFGGFYNMDLEVSVPWSSWILDANSGASGVSPSFGLCESYSDGILVGWQRSEFVDYFEVDPGVYSDPIPTIQDVTVTAPGTIEYPIDRDGERDTVITVPVGDIAMPGKDVIGPSEPSVPYDPDLIVPGLKEGITGLEDLFDKILDLITVLPIEGAVAEEAVKPEPPPQEPAEDIDGLGLPALGALLTTRFPFSIPWDLARSVQLLAAPAVVPVFEVDFFEPISKRVGGWKGSTKITLDFSRFETLAALCRWTSTVGFCFFLIGSTKRYIWTA